MTQTSLESAVARLERAIRRVERAAATPPSPVATRADEGLERRHATLRARVQETIERLDALIAGGGEAG